MPLKNKGTGAGGKNTNKSGKTFEEKVSLQNNLNKYGFKKTIVNKNKFGFYYHLETKNINFYYTIQSGFTTLMKKIYDKNTIRCPDEAIIIHQKNKKPILVIFEIKNQNVEGSVETKLWASPSLKEEYKIYYENFFRVEYVLIFNEFLQNKFLENEKFEILQKILNKNKISCFCGDEPNYLKNIENHFFNKFINKLKI